MGGAGDRAREKVEDVAERREVEDGVERREGREDDGGVAKLDGSTRALGRETEVDEEAGEGEGFKLMGICAVTWHRMSERPRGWARINERMETDPPCAAA
jgi:hypothetical protein